MARKRKGGTITVRMNRDGTYNFRSTGGLDLWKFFPEMGNPADPADESDDAVNSLLDPTTGRAVEASTFFKRKVIASGVCINGNHYGSSRLANGDVVMVLLDADRAGLAHVYSLDQSHYICAAVCPERSRQSNGTGGDDGR